MSPDLVGPTEAGAENVKNADTKDESILMRDSQFVVVRDLVKMADRGVAIRSGSS